MKTTPSISGSACGSPSEDAVTNGNTAARCDSCLTWWPESRLVAVMQGAFPVLRLCPRCRGEHGATDCIHRDPDCLTER